MNANEPEPIDFPAYSPKWRSAPAGFARRATAAVLAQHRAHRRRVWLVRAGGLALAASVILAIAIGLTDRPAVVSIPTTPTTFAAPPKIEPVAPIQKSFAEAGEALQSIGRKTTDKALAPTRTMLASAEKIQVPNGADGNAALETKGLTDATASARAGLDPVASQPRRAMTRMLRDFGIAPAKPRS